MSKYKNYDTFRLIAWLAFVFIIFFVIGSAMPHKGNSTTKDFIFPLLGMGETPFLSQTYGVNPRGDGTFTSASGHWDVPCKEGTMVVAPCTGKIKEFGYENLAGNYITIIDGQGREHVLAHLRRVNPTYKIYAGMDVVAGTIIGYSGNTGHSTGPHLHYKITLNDTAINPRDLIGGKYRV